MLASRQRVVLIQGRPGDLSATCAHLEEAPSGAPQVDVVASLAQAVSLLATARADAIVLDLNLPDSHGLQTLRSVKAAAGGAPIIVLAAQLNDEQREQALGEGAEDVFDLQDAPSRLFSRVVLLVMERQRARGQMAQLQAQLSATHRAPLAPAPQASDIALTDQSEKLKLRSAELELQNQQIREASRLKSEFLANMSHEIRSPMNAVIGLSYLLERTVLDAAQTAHVAMIKVASKTLLSIISNVLDVSKIEAGELSIERATFNLDNVLHDVAALIAVQANAKGVEFIVQVSEALPKTLEGDATRLHQVLTNLLANAVKFTSEGVVRLTVKPVHIGADRVRMRFAVIDSGIGISHEALLRLFKPFVQADASTTRRFGGTGLGLSIVKQLVELMGGTVEASSRLGAGSEFVVELELPISEYTAPPDHYDPDLPATGGRLAGVRLLVVDDSHINLEVAQRILELEGADVWLAGNGQEAVDYLLAMPHAIDVVLMDVQMPVLDGHDATRRIRNGLGLRDLPIIALTAGALTSERQLSVAAGMNDFVSKPFEPDTLVSCIARHVRCAKRPATPCRTEPRPLVGWPQIEGIDSDDVSRRMGGDLKLFKHLLRMMLDTFAESDAPGSTAPRLTSRLHELKGTAGTLGAKAIAAMAAEAETASRSGKTERTRELSAQLARELDALRARAATLLAPANEPVASPDEAPDPNAPPLDQAALARLLQLLRTSDLAASACFSLLAPQLRPRLGPAVFAATEVQVDGLAFDAAIPALQGLAEPAVQPGV